MSPSWLLMALAMLAAIAITALLMALRLRSLRERLAAATAESAALEITRQSLQNELTRLSADCARQQERAQFAEQARSQLAARYEEANARREQLQQDQARLDAELAARGRELAEQREWIDNRSALLQAQMRETANRLLEEKAQRFTEVNQQNLDGLIAPFKTQLSEFRARVDHIYAQDSAERGALREKIESLTLLNQTVAKQALDLTHALTRTSKSVGDWGETLLKKILEDSGLREGHGYRLQVSLESASEDKQRERPDAIIYLPESRQIVIDSKVSNLAWTQYCGESDETLRAQRLREHLASLRAHMRGLAARDYPRAPDLTAVDFVLMFVPVEAALLEALTRDESLYNDAYKMKIILVTPTTLLAVVKLVEGLWSVQRRQENADAIAEAGRKLYEKLVNFAESFEAVGRSIDAARESYEQAQRQLASGKGNAVGLAEKMRRLGVSPARNKQLPETLVKLAGAEDEDPS